MRLGKRTLAGVAAGALSLSLVPFAGAGVSQAVVNGTSATAQSAAYLLGMDAAVKTGTTSGGYTNALVKVSSGSVGVYGMPYVAADDTYSSTTGYNSTSGTRAFKSATESGSGKTVAQNDLFVGIQSPSAAVIEVTPWTDTNNNGQIDIGEPQGKLMTVNFVADTSVVLSATAVPSATVTAGATATVALSAKGNGATLSQTDTWTGSTSTATAWGWATKLTNPAGVETTGTSSSVSVVTSSSAPGDYTVAYAVNTDASDPGSGSVPGGSTKVTATAPITNAAFDDSYGNSAKTGNEELDYTATPSYNLELASAGNLVLSTQSTVVIKSKVVTNAAPVTAVPNALVDLTVTETTATSADQGTFTINGAPVGTSATVVTATTNSAGIATWTITTSKPKAGLVFEVNALNLSGGSTVLTGAETFTWTAKGGPVLAGAVFGQPYSASPPTVQVTPNTAVAVQAAVRDDSFTSMPYAGVTIYLASDGSAYPSTRTAAAAAVSGTTDAEGNVTLNVPGLSQAGSSRFTTIYWLNNGTATPATAINAKIEYKASAVTAVTSELSQATMASAAATAKVVEADGTTTDPADAFTQVAISPVGNTTAEPIVVTVSGGVVAANANGAQATSQAKVGIDLVSGEQSAVILPANANTVVYAYVASKQSGPITITSAVGGKSATSTVTVSAGAPASIAVAPSSGGSVPASVPARSMTKMTATVSDANSNPVPQQNVQVTITGDATFVANGTKTLTGITSTAGTFAFEVMAGDAGSFTVTAAATSTVTTTTSSIAIGAAAKSLTIVSASRSGSNVYVDGDAVGLARGDKVKISVQKWNKDTKKWRKAKVLATVPVKKDASFDAVVSIKGKVRVQAISGDVKSKKVEVKK